MVLPLPFASMEYKNCKPPASTTEPTFHLQEFEIKLGVRIRQSA
jgi:hypothetical protein